MTCSDNLNIVLITDNNYAFLTKICMRSIVKNKKDTTKINFTLVGVDLSETNKQLYNEFNTLDVHTTILAQDNLFLSIANDNRKSVSAAALIKFILPNIIKADKFLYIDGDIIVQTDLSNLFEIDLTDKYAAVCVDQTGELDTKHHLRLNHKHYFNSGLILFNSKRCIENDVPNKLIEWKKTDPYKIFKDQDAFNVVFNEEVIYLDCTYNYHQRYFKFIEKDEKYAFLKLKSLDEIKCYHFSPKKPDRDILALHSKLFWQYCSKEELFEKARLQIADLLEKEKRVVDLKKIQNFIDDRLDYVCADLCHIKNQLKEQEKNPWYKVPFYEKRKGCKAIKLFFIPLLKKVKKENKKKITILGGVLYKKVKKNLKYEVKTCIRIFGFPIYTKKKTPKLIKRSYLGFKICKIRKVDFEKQKESLNYPLSIAVEDGGGIGDVLIHLIYIKEFRKILGKNVNIDLICRNPDFYKNIPYINHVYKIEEKRNTNYHDVYMRARRSYYFEKIDWEKVKKVSSKFYDFCLSTEKVNYEIRKREFDSFKYNHLALLFGKNRLEQADLLENIPVTRYTPKYFPLDANSMSILKEYDLKDYQYITVNRAVDNIYDNLHPKLWPLDYYGELVSLLKKKYPYLKIVQIGSDEKFGIIKGTDLNLLGKTTLNEVAILLKYSLIHIDSEGGMVHLKNFLHGKSVVFFGPTNEKVFGYNENLNLKSTACFLNCDWVNKDWMKSCVLGTHSCMKELKPSLMLQKICNFINCSQQNFSYSSKLISIDECEKLCQNKKIAYIGSLDDYFIKNESKISDLTVFNRNILSEDVVSICENLKCNLEYSSSYNISANDDTFDVVYINEPEKYEYPERVIYEVLRVVKKEGAVVVDIKNIDKKVMENFGSQTSNNIFLIKKENLK